MSSKEKTVSKAPTVSLGFSIISFIICVTLSFYGGCAYRSQMLLHAKVEPNEIIVEESGDSDSKLKENISRISQVTVFEPENLETLYTTKTFSVTGAKEILSVVTDRILDEDDEDDEDEDDEDEDDEDDDEDEDEDEDDDDDEDEDDEDDKNSDENDVENEENASHVDKTGASQLRVGIVNLNAEELENETFLIEKFFDILSDSELPGPLSYHCHAIQKTGVSCHGILGNLPGRGHFVFYTWPEHGSIIFDIAIAPDTNPLLNVVPIFQHAFGVIDPDKEQETCGLADLNSSNCSSDYTKQPRAFWKLVFHGFRRKQKRTDALLHDISDEILDSNIEYIKRIVTAQSIFQRIDVYDYVDPESSSYEQYLKSLYEPDSYEAKHPDFFAPDRMVFLDGVSQSTKHGDEGYHETLVQPAMFAHPNPRRVAIIGGGEGATLREVLRHNTVDHVKMVEIDQVMVETSRQYLPTWSDCSDLVGSTENCLDEPRADVIYEDAVAWFADRTFYPHGSQVTGNSHLHVEQFDVVIVDALDPQDTAEFSDVLYKDDSFLSSVFRSLSDDGIMVMQLGPAPEVNDPAEELTENSNRVLIFKTLERFGFASMQVYEENNCGFEDAWAFVIACKDINCRDNWYSNESEINLAIRERTIKTKSGKPSLKFFDGATMSKYQFSVREWETVYCRSPTPHPECTNFDGFSPTTNVVTSDNFEMKEGSLVAKTDIKEGDLLMLDEQVHSLHFSSHVVDKVQSMSKKFEAVNPIVDYLKEFQLKNGLKYEAGAVYTPSSLLNYAEKQEESNIGNAFLNSGQNKSTEDGIVNVNVYNPIISRRFQQAIITFQAKANIASGDRISV